MTRPGRGAKDRDEEEELSVLNVAMRKAGGLLDQNQKIQRPCVSGIWRFCVVIGSLS